VDVNRALEDVAAGVADARAHPGITAPTSFGSVPGTVIAASIYSEIDGIGRSNGKDLGPDMIAAQRALADAADQIQKFPAIARRDVAVRDIGRIASDFTSARSVLNGNPGPASRAVPNVKGDTGTTSGCLIAIQLLLNDAADSLRKETGAHGEFVDKSIREIKTTGMIVTTTLDFIKNHPNLDPLLAPATSGASPMAAVPVLPYGQKMLYDLGLSIREQGVPPSVTGTQVALYPNLSQGLFFLRTAMDVAFHEFLNHPDDRAELNQYDNSLIAILSNTMHDVVSGIDYVEGPFAGRPGLSHNTTLGHLAVAQRSIKEAISSVQKDPVANYGGSAEKALADLQKAMADIDKAVSFVQAHPEIDTLQMGTTPTATPRGPTTTNPPAYARAAFPNMVAAVNSLNTAIKEFMNISTQPRMPVLGEIGGFRDILMTDINTAAREIVSGMDYAHAQGR
jgi:hypothetical protein